MKNVTNKFGSLGGTKLVSSLMLNTIALLLLCMLTINANAQLWSNTPSLPSARFLHTNTLLPNGNVLVVGGTDFNVNFLTCHIYNPSTNSWSNAASSPHARLHHTATLLSNGKVLVAGGEQVAPFTHCDLYDPATNTWSSAGSLATGRESATATLLPNGKVLLSSGVVTATNTLTNSCELYDPSTNSWTTVAPMAVGRKDHTATLLPNGKIFIAAGRDLLNNPFNSCELYDPSTNTWSNAASMAVGHYLHNAVLLQNGKVLIVAGFTIVCELYDYATNSWSLTPNFSPRRMYQNSLLLPNGKVLITGGLNADNFVVLSVTQLYDPATNTFSTMSASNTAASMQASTLLSDGRVLKTGGYNGSSALNASELFTYYCDSINITTPGNLVVSTDAGQCTAVVNYTVTSNNNSFPITSSQNSGTAFNKGTTTINLSEVVGCPTLASFTVTVNDNEPPTISCAGNVSISNVAGQCYGTTTLTPPTIGDNCGSGNALNFDGSNDYIISSLNGAGLTQVSLEFWFKKGNTSSKGIFQWANNLTSSTPWIYIHDQGTTIRLYVNGNYNITPTTTFTTGNWYHLAVTYDGNTWKLYYNGTLAGTYTGPIGSFGRNNPYFGNGFNGFWNGSIDEAVIWNTALTQAQIQANMNAELSAQSGVVALYHFNNGTAGGNNAGNTTAIDASGNINNGTLNNFALTGTTSNWVSGYLSVPLTATNNAPSTYPEGTTTVTWTATDPSGNTATCSQTVTVTVTDNVPPVITCPQNITVCSPTTVSYVATATDNCGNPTISYSPVSGSTFNVGTTTVTVTANDGHGNTATCSFTVTVLANTLPSFTTVNSNVSGCGASNNGFIQVNATGGTGTKMYSKNNGVTYQTSALLSGLTVGTYNVIVKDANNCTSPVSSIPINQNAPVTFTTTTVDASACATANGRITVAASGGAGYYNYSKNGGTNYQASSAFASLLPGTYSIKVKDILGCTSSITSVNVGPNCREDISVKNNINNLNSFSIYPNPAKDEATIIFTSDKEENYTINMIDISGREVIHYASESLIGDNQIQINLSGLSNGLYLIRLLKGDTIMQSKLVKE